jgi:hypothetical protein
MTWVCILRVDGYYIIVLDASFAVNFLMFLLLGVFGGIFRKMGIFKIFWFYYQKMLWIFYIFKFLEFYVVD